MADSTNTAVSLKPILKEVYGSESAKPSKFKKLRARFTKKLSKKTTKSPV